MLPGKHKHACRTLKGFAGIQWLERSLNGRGSERASEPGPRAPRKGALGKLIS
jgi:hypothetical protein